MSRGTRHGRPGGRRVCKVTAGALTTGAVLEVRRPRCGRMIYLVGV